LGYLCALPLPPLLGLSPKWGVVGLTASAGLCGWLEFALLRNALNRRIGRTGLPASFVLKLWAAAGVGAAGGWIGKLMMPPSHPVVLAIVSLGLYGMLYFAVTFAFQVREAKGLIARAAGLFRGHR
jgi:putative peptidoglycan lipid II flippase